jgi:hypothetical protein
MPTVFRSGGFRFFFYSDEGNPREPPHIHVRGPGQEAKVWLQRGLPHAYNRGFSAVELRRVQSLIETNREQIEAAWNEFFN